MKEDPVAAFEVFEFWVVGDWSRVSNGKASVSSITKISSSDGGRRIPFSGRILGLCGGDVGGRGVLLLGPGGEDLTLVKDFRVGRCVDRRMTEGISCNASHSA